MKWRRLLWPFSLLYDSVTRLRNTAFDRGWLPSQSYPLPIIAIGNLSTGGTGKTPMVEFLLQHLHPYRRAVVSRGYGRKTRGLLWAGAHHTAADIGDEPAQMRQKFPEVDFVLSEKRVEALEALMENPPEVVLLDDAFQHRYVSPDLTLMLTTYQNPFYKDLVLPAGNLRESAQGKDRADLIIVTKCPRNLPRQEADAMIRNIRPRPGQSVYFTSLDYGGAVSLEEQSLPPGSPVVAVTGIARPELFREYIGSLFDVRHSYSFKDHHVFSAADIRSMETLLRKNPAYRLLTTEKDCTRLAPLLSASLRDRLYVLPVKVDFLFSEKSTFLDRVKGCISNFESKKTPPDQKR